MSLLTLVTTCRSCAAGPLELVLSLGRTPLANSLLPAEGGVSPTYPLDLMRCTNCSLVQLAQIVSPDALFSEYVYFTSNSETMLRHAESLADRLIESEHLGPETLVVELASNDGYLLQFFKERSIPVLGIEPAANIARFAESEKGIPTLVEFFGRAVAEDLAKQNKCADVIVGNNVLAHVPDVNDFIAGVTTLLKPSGIAVFEVPYLRAMLDEVEFDTIYHEHQCYFSLTALRVLFLRHGLELVDVERVAIHGGSLRVSAARVGHRQPTFELETLLADEESWVLDSATYACFGQSVNTLKGKLLALLDRLKSSDARLVAYGAAAKGVTLTSYCGIGRQHLDYVVDRSPHKQGLCFPVDSLPIWSASRLAVDRPEYALLLTWNFAAEIVAQQAAYLAVGGKFVVPLPEPRML